MARGIWCVQSGWSAWPCPPRAFRTHPVLHIRIASPTALGIFIVMLSLCLYAPLAALITYVAAVVAAPSLVVRTSFNSNLRNVEGSNNLKVTTTVVNTGGRTLKLFNDPRGVLDPFPENTFSITNATGFRPPFNGAKVNDVSWLYDEPVC